MAELESLATECQLYYHQPWSEIELSTISWLQSKYQEALRREKKLPAEPSDESEEERNRRVLLAALKQQQAQDKAKTGKHTRYVGDQKGLIVDGN